LSSLARRAKEEGAQVNSPGRKPGEAVPPKTSGHARIAQCVNQERSSSLQALITTTQSRVLHLFSIGFISILGQVVLLRELNVAFYGVELIYTIAIGLWLIWSGIGTVIGIRTQSPPPVRIHLFFLLLSVTIVLGIACIRAIRIIFFATPGAYLPLNTQLLAIALSLMPFGLILGLLFRWSARSYIETGHSLTAAYAVESLGGIAGGLAATFLLMFGIQNFVAGIICALAATAAAIPTVKKIGGWFLRSTLAVLAIAWILCLWNSSALDLFMTSWTHPDLVTSRDSPYSRITVDSREGQIVVFENDSLLFHSEGIRAEEFTHLAALQHPHPDRVLLLGGGFEGILEKIQDHSPGFVDYVELNPVLLDIVRNHFPPGIGRSLETENVRLHIDDPRRFLQTSGSYDLMLAGMPEPFSGQANRFYTLEFFRQCAAKLNPGGILAFRMPWSENYMSRPMIDRMAGVYLAAKSVFPEVLVLPGTDSMFLCSQSPLVEDPSTLVSRISSRNLKSSIVTASYLRYVYTNNRFRETEALIRSSASAVNTDSRPVCYRYTLLIWLAKFQPSLESWNFVIIEGQDKRLLYAGGFLIIAIPAILLYGTGWKLRRTVLMGVAGFAGMVLETVLLLHFQIKNGILFQDVGILLTSFMIGLYLGAIALGKVKHSMSRYIGSSILVGFVLLSGGIGLTIYFDIAAGLAATFILLLSTGFMVAATFAYTGLREPRDQSKSVIPLYSADLIGGGLGSLFAGILMVPVAGLAISAFLIVPITGLSLLLVLKK